MISALLEAVDASPINRRPTSHLVSYARLPQQRVTGGSARGTIRPTLVSSSRAHSTPKVRTMKTLVAVAILAMVLVPPRSGEGEAGAIGAGAIGTPVVGSTPLLPRLPSEWRVPRLFIRLPIC